MKDCVSFKIMDGLSELFYCMDSVYNRNFRDEAEELVHRYRSRSKNTWPVLIRFHVSDIANQYNDLCDILRKYGVENAAIIEQTPLRGGKLALEAWHYSRQPENYQIKMFQSSVTGVSGSEAQMRCEFENLEKMLPVNASVSANIIRTWIYCRDLDNNYAGLVKARRELFTQWGMTEKTHYIASTGIEGKSYPHDRLVRMDSLGIFGLPPEQIEYMQALEHLSPTQIYGVTFERGTRIIYGNCSSYFISGTASIDKCGEIMYPGNVEAQSRRMLENVEALLNNHGAQLHDLKQAVIYLRDAKDKDLVESYLQQYLDDECTYLILQSSICRPGWLLEIDGIAVNNHGNENYKALR